MAKSTKELTPLDFQMMADFLDEEGFNLDKRPEVDEVYAYPKHFVKDWQVALLRWYLPTRDVFYTYPLKETNNKRILCRNIVLSEDLLRTMLRRWGLDEKRHMGLLADVDLIGSLTPVAGLRFLFAGDFVPLHNSIVLDECLNSRSEYGKGLAGFYPGRNAMATLNEVVSSQLWPQKFFDCRKRSGVFCTGCFFIPRHFVSVRGNESHASCSKVCLSYSSWVVGHLEEAIARSKIGEIRARRS